MFIRHLRKNAPYVFIFAALICAVIAAIYFLRNKSEAQKNAAQTQNAIAAVPTVAPEIKKEPEIKAEPEEVKQGPSEVRIEVNIPATEITLYADGDELFHRRVAIGQGIYPTPEQDSKITRIEWNPWWYPPPDAAWAKDAKDTPPGRDNPLGLVKMPLSDEILFHGTNKAWSVGLPASHGCMRMHNRDVTDMAWYLQKNFSDKSDPSYRERYKKEASTTFTVHLKQPVPVKIVYRPVVAKNDSLIFYPDHYNRYSGKRKAAIIAALLNYGVAIDEIDDEKIDELVKNWPGYASKISIETLVRGYQINFADGGECM